MPPDDVPLRPEAKLTAGWARDKPAALAACGLGLLALVVATAVQLWRNQLFAVNPDLRLTIPFLLATLIATVASLARRERAYALAVGGLAMAISALVLGWALLLVIVAAVAGVLIYVLGEVL